MRFDRHPDVFHNGDEYECYCTPIGHVYAHKDCAELVIPKVDLPQFFGVVHADPRFAMDTMLELERALDPAADWRWNLESEAPCAN